MKIISKNADFMLVFAYLIAQVRGARFLAECGVVFGAARMVGWLNA